MNNQLVFGVDLGTTNTVVAVPKGNNLPSVVAIRNLLSHLQSWHSKAAQFLSETILIRQTVRLMKRLMGLPLQQFDKTNRNYSMLSYKVVQDKESSARNNSPSTVPPLKICFVSLQYKNKECLYRLEMISGLLLAMTREELVSMYNLQGQRPVVVISVPAYFSTVQRRATKAAGLMAGFDVLRVVNEPTAGAFAYALDHRTKANRIVLVYDFGGGTFACTTLQRLPVKNGTAMQVIATKENHL